MAARKKATKKVLRPKPEEVLGDAAPGVKEAALEAARVAAAAAAAPPAQDGALGGPRGSAVVKDAVERLSRDKVWVPYAGGFWAKPKARLIQGRPVGSVGAFLVVILERKKLGAFTKFKATRGGKIPIEFKPVGGK